LIFSARHYFLLLDSLANRKHPINGLFEGFWPAKSGDFERFESEWHGCYNQIIFVCFEFEERSQVITALKHNSCQKRCRATRGVQVVLRANEKLAILARRESA
jgi:hypothetical protein